MIKRLKPKTEFSRNVLTLMTGTTIAQAIPIAISPILTRIYTPEDFGVLALYLSIAAIVASIATGKYELAIMLPRNNELAINIVALSIIISFFISMACLLIVSIFNSQITNLLGNPEISNWLYLIPVTVMFTGIIQSFNYWNSRKKQYKKLSISRVAQSGTTATSNLAMGFNGYGSSGLILSGVLGQGIAAGMLTKMFWNEDSKLMLKVNKLKILASMKRYIEFPKVATFTSLLNVMSVQMPIMIMANAFSLQVVGFYSLSHRIMSLPIGLISSSVGQVFFQQISSMNLKNMAIIFENTLLKLLKIAAPLFALFIIFGDKIFYFIFGQDWIVAGEYVQIISFWLFSVFIISPLTHIFNVLEKQKLFLKLNFLSFSLRVLSLMIGAFWIKEVPTTLYLFTGSGVLVWILILSIMLSFLNISKTHIFFTIGKYLSIWLLIFYLLSFFIGGFLWYQ